MSADLEAKLEQDHRYKNYASNVHKCLKASEQAREWADLISFLGRLNKVCRTTSRLWYWPRPFRQMVSASYGWLSNACVLPGPGHSLGPGTVHFHSSSPTAGKTPSAMSEPVAPRRRPPKGH